MRGTYPLKRTDGQTSQDIERTQVSKEHSLPEEHRRIDKSGHGNNLSKLRALTNWRAQTDGQVRTWKEWEHTRGTHRLESADGWTSQDGETIRASERNSHPGEHRRMNK